eukprot:scaffold194_cov277-Pinguiococcus_pyrenoidosus.AAC.12
MEGQAMEGQAIEGQAIESNRTSAFKKLHSMWEPRTMLHTRQPHVASAVSDVTSPSAPPVGGFVNSSRVLISHVPSAQKSRHRTRSSTANPTRIPPYTAYTSRRYLDTPRSRLEPWGILRAALRSGAHLLYHGYESPTGTMSCTPRVMASTKEKAATSVPLRSCKSGASCCAASLMLGRSSTTSSNAGHALGATTPDSERLAFAFSCRSSHVWWLERQRDAVVFSSSLASKSFSSGTRSARNIVAEDPVTWACAATSRS